MSNIIEKIGQVKLVPVVVIENADDAEPLAQALMENGLPCAEITLRTPAATEAILRLSKIDGLLLGAGTVLSVDQAKQAVDAGAQFIVAPGLSPKVVQYCVGNNIPITPGVCTPGEIEAALEFGLNVLKFFPAEAFGGLKTLKAISAPYATVRFIPTGGIGPGNVQDYLRAPNVHACGGSWMVKTDLIASGKFAEIGRLTKEAVALRDSA